MSGFDGKSSETIDLKPLFASEVTASGSFDLRQLQYSSFEALLQVLSVPTLLVDCSHVIKVANKAFRDFSNILDAVGHHFSDLFTSAAFEGQSLLEEVIRFRRSQVREAEMKLGSKAVWARIHLQPIRLSTELTILIQIENLTAEKELKISQKYKKMVDIFPIGIAEFSVTKPIPCEMPPHQLFEEILQARMVDGNAEFANMHGYGSTKDLLGLELTRLIPLKGRGRPIFRQWIAKGFPMLSFDRKERCSTEPAKYFENSLIANIDDQTVLGLWWIKRDISEKRRIDAEMQRAQKLESLGLLAGGIAHDFNNLLTGILGNISLGLMHTEQSQSSLERFEAALRAGRQAQDLTNQLLTFSTGGAPIKKAGSLGQLIEDCASFVLRGSNVRCECSISKDLWAIEMDAGQVSQVVNNLLINAIDSMPRGGPVLIRASNFIVRGEMKLPLEPGRYVRTSISDRGHGIKKEIIRKIFDPYFTTKKKGNGLGLSTSYFIIKKHGGLITLRTKVGVGTTFSFFLPAAQLNSMPSEETEKLLIRGRGKVLLMDDEEIIRELSGQILKILGYEVTFATTGQEAIQLCRDEADRGQYFDAAILDLTVRGGMGGQETLQKLLEIDPGLKAIASSGYANSLVMSDHAQYGFKAVLKKPYDAIKMGEVLDRVIKGKSDQQGDSS
jgi:two-component system, cell cycle sensor histidine kinase and response regulator CckA